MLEFLDPVTALRIYKIFHSALVATARLKKGRIRTFAGDRIGVIFDLLKERQRSTAVETAILMEDMLENIVNPFLENNIGHTIKYGIGIDYGKMFVGRIGQSGSDNNDLAWVGTAMNRASKLADIPEPGIYITNEVYTNMQLDLKDPSKMMWSMPIRNTDYGLIYKYFGYE